MKNRIILLAILPIFVFYLTSCKKNEGSKKYNGPNFSLEKFDQELRASLEPSGAIGWAYTINQNGLLVKSKAYGKSRNSADGNLPFTLNKKINLASVSKFLTAVAVVQLLERKSLSVNTKIAPFLPFSWNKGPGVADITFADLLGHTSGLSSANTLFSKTLGYQGLRLCIDTGRVLSKDYRYLNANFALFRILIPSLWRGMDGAPNISATLDSATTENAFVKYMQENIFEPIGLTNIDFVGESRDAATMYYATTDLDANNGVSYGSWTHLSGGGGLYMSTMELARFLAYYKHTNILLSGSQRKILEDNRFGLDRQDTTREIHGSYYGKNGSISDGNGRGTLEQIVMFPGGIEVAVVFNTQGMVFAGGTSNIRRAIYDAYNKSWE